MNSPGPRERTVQVVSGPERRDPPLLPAPAEHDVDLHVDERVSVLPAGDERRFDDLPRPRAQGGHPHPCGKEKDRDQPRDGGHAPGTFQSLEGRGKADADRARRRGLPGRGRRSTAGAVTGCDHGVIRPGPSRADSDQRTYGVQVPTKPGNGWIFLIGNPLEMRCPASSRHGSRGSLEIQEAPGVK